MGIVSSAKPVQKNLHKPTILFQSPMGIVSSAKLGPELSYQTYEVVSIPDGDSFLREGHPRRTACLIRCRVSIPDGDSFLREDSVLCT